jgi:hypothetical protein
MIVSIIALALAPAVTPRVEDVEVLAAVQRFFDAVEQRDVAAMSRTVDADGLATAVRLTDGAETRKVNWHWPSYFENVRASKGVLVEKLFNPEVRIERDIASVWARYELIVDGKFSHCGVDHFDMVKRGGEWRVYNLTWTNQKTGCAGR